MSGGGARAGGPLPRGHGWEGPGGEQPHPGRFRWACRSAMAVSRARPGPLESRGGPPRGGSAEAPSQQPFLHQPPGVNRHRGPLTCREERRSEGGIGPPQVGLGAEGKRRGDQAVLAFVWRVKAFAMLRGGTLRPQCACTRRARAAALEQGLASRALPMKPRMASESVCAPGGPRFCGTSPGKPCAAHGGCRA